MFGITLLVFVAIRLAPGDPATVMMGIGTSGEIGAASNVDERIEAFRTRHALDKPLFVQYLGFVGPFNVKPDGHPWFGGSGANPWGGLLALDLGNEFQRTTMPIVEELGRRLKVTIPLSLISTLLIYLVALPTGIYSAVRSGTRRDALLTLVLFVLYSIPTFWAGLMLILSFGAAGVSWLPVLGLHGKDAADMGMLAYAWDTVLHCILPIATLTYGGLAYLSRQMRVGMIDVIKSDYIRTARAKGLSEKVVVLKHAGRNSLIPVITLFASILPLLIGGSLIVEVVFDIPGMGRYAFEGLIQRDYGIIMATTTFSALMTLVGILLSDIAYALVDPRISYE
jgi:peptide/nickel transport system permease protein